MGALSDTQREYLLLCGLSKKKIARCAGSTRMYHDLGLYGEIADGCMSVLVDHYHVDLSGLEFEKFFPPEFPGRNMLTRALFWITPFADKVVRHSDEYLPLTLDMIDRMIQTKRWSPSTEL